jgi:hypothetical protein
MDQEDTLSEVTTRHWRNTSIESSNNIKLQEMVKEYVSSQELQAPTIENTQSISSDRRAPSTLKRRQRIMDLWTAFSEEKGFDAWDKKGPSIGMCGNLDIKKKK